ncbi:hypothetical protein AB0I30_21090 [Nocardia tengchongensis]|uniref:hypothetical protein n=1 Tax=Nocardia tengchongensis TaxID=2055889 RepID=UPI0033CE64E9
MDLDEIGRRSEELAARLGVPSPDVESGSLPEWCLNGLRLHRRKRQAVVVVGATFDGLSAAEQEGALAYVVAAAGFVVAAAGRDNTGLKRVSRILGFVLGAALSLTIVLGAMGSSAALASASVMVLSVFAFVAMIVAWTRRMIYRTDHLVTEVMGRPVMDMLFAREHRGPRPPGLRGLYSRVAVPSDRQRLERLNAVLH